MKIDFLEESQPKLVLRNKALQFQDIPRIPRNAYKDFKEQSVTLGVERDKVFPNTSGSQLKVSKVYKVVAQFVLEIHFVLFCAHPNINASWTSRVV